MNSCDVQWLIYISCDNGWRHFYISHYMIQCWHFDCWTSTNHLQWNFNHNPNMWFILGAWSSLSLNPNHYWLVAERILLSKGFLYVDHDSVKWKLHARANFINVALLTPPLVGRHLAFVWDNLASFWKHLRLKSDVISCNHKLYEWNTCRRHSWHGYDFPIASRLC